MIQDGLEVQGSIYGAGLTLSDLTATRVLFAGVGGVISDDSDMTFSGDRLTVTGLTVTGNSVFGLNSSVFQPIADSTTFLQVLDANGGTPILNVDSTNERVGIGTSAPNAPLEVKGPKPGIVGGFQSGMFHVTNNDTDEFSNSVITGHNSYDTNTQLWYLGNTSGLNNDIAFINRKNAPLHFYTNNTSRMTIDAAGNVGIGTTSPDTKLQVVGDTKLGDDNTNYLNVDSSGRVLLKGTAQTWEDIRIIPGAFQFPGVADPTLESWQPGGAGATFKVYKFKINDEVHFTCQIPHNYKEGSDLKPHLHWTPCDRGNEENGNTVGWKIDYSWANADATFASSATVDLSDACSGIDDQHEQTDSGTITGTNKNISGLLQIRLYRSDTNADDTWVGVTAALSPAILEFDLHYEIDGFGSDLELVKDAP